MSKVRPIKPLPLEGEIADRLPAITIEEYKPFLEAADALAEKYGHVPDAATTEGYANIKAGLKAIAAPRVELDKVRKAIKAPALARTKAIDGEAKAIRDRLEALEVPLKKAKADFDNREALALAKRQQEQRLSLMDEFSIIRLAGQEKQRVASMLSLAETVAIEAWPDILDEAAAAKAEFIERAQAILAKFRADAEAAAEREKLRLEREKFEAEKAAADAKAAAEMKKIAEQQRAAAAEQKAADARLATDRAALEAEKRKSEEASIVQVRAARAERRRAAELEEEARAELEAKTDAEMVEKMRGRLGEVDWSKVPSDKVRGCWSVLKS